jgi:hypothetical protein
MDLEVLVEAEYPAAEDTLVLGRLVPATCQRPHNERLVHLHHHHVVFFVIVLVFLLLLVCVRENMFSRVKRKERENKNPTA